MLGFLLLDTPIVISFIWCSSADASVQIKRPACLWYSSYLYHYISI